VRTRRIRKVIANRRVVSWEVRVTRGKRVIHRFLPNQAAAKQVVARLTRDVIET
jgi:hypothetical protein